MDLKTLLEVLFTHVLASLFPLNVHTFWFSFQWQVRVSSLGTFLQCESKNVPWKLMCSGCHLRGFLRGHWVIKGVTPFINSWMNYWQMGLLRKLVTGGCHFCDFWLPRHEQLWRTTCLPPWCFCLTKGLKAMEPASPGLRPLKPWDQIDISSFSLFFLRDRNSYLTKWSFL